MAGDWRISAEERVRYESYFQQCNPVLGYLSGEQARDFFVKSTLPGDILRKIWDLADVTSDGRLDKREFVIACCLITSQVQKKGSLPSSLPPSLLSDSGPASNGAPLAGNMPDQSAKVSSSQPTTQNIRSNPSIVLLTPAIRSRYLQQFQSLVDVAKTNGFMSGLQAKTILLQTGLPNTLLHQIWTLSDNDKDGSLTADEFVIAMHCCDIARTGQSLPSHFPEEWSSTAGVERDRANGTPTFANLNQQLKETFHSANATETTPSNESTEAERKAAMVTYEEKRLKNIEDGNRELERRRQLLREQEEREFKEREERERKREFEIQKQKDEQERKKQMEIDRQLEKQRQIEQQKEEERKKLYEQREAARKEMERKSRLEWERQRLQELSTQKSRLLEQINDLKSREKAFALEIESMNDTTEASQTKISQVETNIQTIDQEILDVQRNISTERNHFEDVEQQKKALVMQLNDIKAERESLDASVNHLHQSKEFNMANRESDQIKSMQTQMENMTQEYTQTEEQISSFTDQCKEWQNQIEQLRLQFTQLEQDAKDAKPLSKPASPIDAPAEFGNFDQFNAHASSNDLNNESSNLPVVVTSTSPPPTSTTVDVDPFQTVDPFASQSDIGATATNPDWFQPTNNQNELATVDPFVPSVKPEETLAAVASPKVKKAAPKAKAPPAAAAAADPWGGATNTNSNGKDWAPFDNTTHQNKDASSPFGAATEWPQTTDASEENGSDTKTMQYRALYDYVAERSDELTMSAGDIIEVDPTKQQDEHWLFGQIGTGNQGVFPVAYAELITSKPTSHVVDTTSPLASGSWVMTLAECQGKTEDKHLSFSKGELIHVREQKDTTWYSGQLHDKIGWFPRSYVRPAKDTELENQSSDTPINKEVFNSSTAPPTNEQPFSHVDNDDLYEAIYAYEATDSSDLTFDVGELITVSKRDGDWWTGQIGDRTGTFPSNYVQKVGHDQKTVPPPPEENRTESSQYITLFPYEAQQDDELSFPADTVLEILDPGSTSGWFKARLGDQEGLIPSTYVQPVDAQNP